MAEDIDRDLAAYRKALEREFDAKLRDLKAQHKRQADKLQQDRVDWEEHRRAQAKELADRAEKLRRQDSNKETRVQVTAANLQELDALRKEVRELGAALRHERHALADAKALASAAQGHLRASRSLAAWVVAIALAGLLAWLVAGWDSRTGILILAASATATTGLALVLRLRKPRQAPAGQQD